MEKATNTPENIREQIKEIYQADVQAIKNLGDIASSMITEDGTLTLPYNVNITGDLNVNENLSAVGSLTTGGNLNMDETNYIYVGNFVLGRYPDSNYTEFAIKHKDSEWWDGIRVNNEGYLKVNDGLYVGGSLTATDRVYMNKNCDLKGTLKIMNPEYPNNAGGIHNAIDLVRKYQDANGNSVDHRWVFWHMNAAYGNNDLQIYEYNPDHTGKTCGGDAVKGARCHARFKIKGLDGGVAAVHTMEVGNNLTVANNLNVTGSLSANGTCSIGDSFEAGVNSGRKMVIQSSNHGGEQTYLAFFNGSNRTSYMAPQTDGRIYFSGNIDIHDAKFRIKNMWGQHAF